MEKDAALGFEMRSRAYPMLWNTGGVREQFTRFPALHHLAPLPPASTPSPSEKPLTSTTSTGSPPGISSTDDALSNTVFLAPPRQPLLPPQMATKAAYQQQTRI
jgi:hypothetical protein